MKRLALSWQNLILAPSTEGIMIRRGPLQHAFVERRAPTASLAVFDAPVADTARFGVEPSAQQSSAMFVAGGREIHGKLLFVARQLCIYNGSEAFAFTE